jgi:hypothetical protein
VSTATFLGYGDKVGVFPSHLWISMIAVERGGHGLNRRQRGLKSIVETRECHVGQARYTPAPLDYQAGIGDIFVLPDAAHKGWLVSATEPSSLRQTSNPG